MSQTTNRRYRMLRRPLGATITSDDLEFGEEPIPRSGRARR